MAAVREFARYPSQWLVAFWKRYLLVNLANNISRWAFYSAINLDHPSNKELLFEEEQRLINSIVRRDETVMSGLVGHLQEGVSSNAEMHHWQRLLHESLRNRGLKKIGEYNKSSISQTCCGVIWRKCEWMTFSNNKIVASKTTEVLKSTEKSTFFAHFAYFCDIFEN